MAARQINTTHITGDHDEFSINTIKKYAANIEFSPGPDLSTMIQNGGPYFYQIEDLSYYHT